MRRRVASDEHRRVDLNAELTWRPLERTAVKDWARLLDAIEAVDKEEEIIGEDDLTEEFDDPNHDFARGSIAAYHDQVMVAYGVIIARSTAPDIHNMYLRGWSPPRVSTARHRIKAARLGRASSTISASRALPGLAADTERTRADPRRWG